MPKHKKHHDGHMMEHEGRSSEHRTHRVMKARGHGMVQENMSMRSNLPDMPIYRDLGSSPYRQEGQLPGPYEGVEQQMSETQFDFRKEFKPYK